MEIADSNTRRADVAGLDRQTATLNTSMLFYTVHGDSWSALSDEGDGVTLLIVT
jgi:hypothetical protein